MEDSSPSKNCGTDILRIAAAFGVIMLHCTGASSAAGRGLDGLFRFSVPVFVIISGYYLLAQKQSGRKLLKKSLRLFALMIGTSAVYYLYDLLTGALAWEGPADLAAYLLTQPVHLWYLYAAITLYILTPLLYVFCQHATKRQFQYALLLTFFFGGICVIALRSSRVPLLEEILGKMHVPYTQGFVCLYLTGAYLRRFDVPKIPLLTAGLLSAAVTVLGEIFFFDRGIDFLSFFLPTTILAAAALFEAVLQLTRSCRPKPFLHAAARATLGVYLIHPLVIKILGAWGIFRGFWYSESSGFAMLLQGLIVFVCSFLLSMLPQGAACLVRRLKKARAS